MKMPFLKLKLPGEQTELTKKRSSVQTIMHVHYPARQIRNFDVRNNNNNNNTVVPLLRDHPLGW